MSPNLCIVKASYETICLPAKTTVGGPCSSQNAKAIKAAGDIAPHEKRAAPSCSVPLSHGVDASSFSHLCQQPQSANGPSLSQAWPVT